MEKCKLTPGQCGFIGLLVCLLTVGIASVLVYPMNGVGLRRFLHTYQFSMLGRIRFDSNIRDDIRWNAVLSLLYGFLASVVIAGALIIKAAMQKPSLYGDAKFASDADIRRSKAVTWGDESKGGVIIGRYKGKLLRYIAPDFISMGAGTRAGKGAAIVIPNLLAWLFSVIVLDPKQECYKITSKFRQLIMGQKVYLLDPFSSKTHGFNPLFYIDLSHEKGSGYLFNLAETLWNASGLPGTEAHFNSAAGRVFIGYTQLLYTLINHGQDYLAMYDVKPVFSIGTVLDLYYAVNREALLANGDESECPDIKSRVANNGNEREQYLLRDALNKIKEYNDLGDEPRSSTEGTFFKKLHLFTLPLFRKATDRNDFDLRLLRKERMTIYLGVNADDLIIADDFLNLFFNFAINVSMRENPDFETDNKYDVLFLLDEFPAVGAMHYIKKASGFIAGFKLKLLTIYQNISQLIEIYGEMGAKTLLSGHPCRVIYAVSEKEDADKFSAQLGYTTTKSTGKSRNRNKGSVSQGESENEAQRALVLPQELGTLKFHEEFILLKGENPIKCEKALYFNDPYFMDRLCAVSPKLRERVASMNNGSSMVKKGLKYPPKEEMLSLGELEAELV